MGNSTVLIINWLSYKKPEQKQAELNSQLEFVKIKSLLESILFNHSTCALIIS